MVKNIIEKLSLSYLSKHIKIEDFNIAKKTYERIIQDGHFERELSDKKLASSLFEHSIPSSYFENKKNLAEFCQALPSHILDKIHEELNLKTNELKWDTKISNYFIEELGLPKKFLRKNKISTGEIVGYKTFDTPVYTFKNLKDYQSKIYHEVYSYISLVPYSRCIIQMPTGSGKTRTSMEIVCEVLNDSKQNILWLANTEELCDQAYESFIEVWRFLRKKKAQVINHGRHNGTYDFNTQTFHIATLQSFNIEDKEDKIRRLHNQNNGIGLVIVDEAHISVAPTYKDTIQKLLSKGAKLIGLTATPGRGLGIISSDDKIKSDNQIFSDFYFNKKFEIDTGKELPIVYLRNKGILSNAKFISIEGSTVENILSESEKLKLNQSNEIPNKIKVILTNNHSRNAIIFDKLIGLLEEGKKILFFGTSIKHSKLITTLINLKGFKAAHIDGNSGTYRKKTINLFKNGNLNMLCNYGVLSTGFDDPKIDVVFMARPTKSIVLYSQIIGRGLRGPKIGGTETCEIFTVFDNILDLPKNNEIYSYFDEYFMD
jgi:DNA repair protein RadD